MVDNKTLMIQGKIYDPSDPILVKERLTAHNLCREYNSLTEDAERRQEILKYFFPDAEGLYLTGPIFFDYGTNIKFGKNCYANFNFTVIDVCPVIIEDNVFFGPNVSILLPLHPLLAEERKLYFDEDKQYWTDKEYGKPVHIGEGTWIAGNVVINGGVKIGKHCVIGSGSVVTRDIPDGCLAFGNPAKVVRKLDKNDSIYLKKELF